MLPVLPAAEDTRGEGVIVSVVVSVTQLATILLPNRQMFELLCCTQTMLSCRAGGGFSKEREAERVHDDEKCL